MDQLDYFLDRMQERGVHRAVFFSSKAAEFFSEESQIVGPRLSRDQISSLITDISPIRIVSRKQYSNATDITYAGTNGEWNLFLKQIDDELELTIIPKGSPQTKPEPPVQVNTADASPRRQPLFRRLQIILVPALLILLIILAVGGHSAYENILAKQRIRQIVIRDTVLIASMLNLEKDAPSTTYVEYFEKAKNNRDERDQLILQAQALAADRYGAALQNFAHTMEGENEYIRADEATRRQSMEVQSKQTVYEEVRVRYSNALKERTLAAADYDAAQAEYSSAVENTRLAVNQLTSDLNGSTDGLDNLMQEVDTAKYYKQQAEDAGERLASPAGTLSAAAAAADSTSGELTQASRNYDSSMSELHHRLATTAKALTDLKRLEEAGYPAVIPTRNLVPLLLKKIISLRDYAPEPGVKGVKIIHLPRPTASGADASAENTPTAASQDDRMQLMTRYKAWQAAWEHQDLDLFLSFYSKSAKIQDSDGTEFGIQELKRRRGSRWNTETNVKITDVNEPQVMVFGAEAEIVANKSYSSSASNYHGIKTTKWAKSNGQWYILSERFKML